MVILPARKTKKFTPEMVGIISIANGAGRFVWAWLSDLVGRRAVFISSPSRFNLNSTVSTYNIKITPDLPIAL
jgi:MFS family permease